MSDPNANGSSTRDFDLLSIVLELDPDHYKPDVAYEFSGGRRFLSTDSSDSGVYDGS